MLMVAIDQAQAGDNAGVLLRGIAKEAVERGIEGPENEPGKRKKSLWARLFG